MNAFDLAQSRAQFPALNDTGVYLDGATTALKPQAVVGTIHQFYSLNAGNAHRSQFAEAQRPTARYKAAREKVTHLINTSDDKTIVWTRGTTEVISIVAQSCARPRLRPDDEIIVNAAEHHANLVPWLTATEQTGAKAIRLPPTPHLLLDVKRFTQLITPHSRILALGQMSNVTGGCLNLTHAITLAHVTSMAMMVGSAQGIVHYPADVQWLDIDFYVFSDHKLYGSTGIGVLYGRSELLGAMSPWLGDSKMISKVSFDGFITQPAPWGLGVGTPNAAGVIGLGAALEWLADVGVTQAENWSRGLAALTEDALAKCPGFRSFRCQGSSLLAFDFAGVHHSDMVTLLTEYGIALHVGQRCAQPLLAEPDVSGTLHTSFTPYNIQSNVDALVTAVDRALRILVGQ